MVAPVRRALGFTVLDNERTCYDSGDVVRRHEHRPCDFAGAVKLGQWNYVLIGGNLENRIRGRIDNPASTRALVSSEAVHHVGTAAYHIPDHAAPCLARKSLDQLARKPTRIRWERTLQVHARNFPMSRCAVFARRGRPHASPRASRVAARRDAFDRSDIAQAESLQSWKLEPSKGARDVPECVASGITVIRSIGRFADADSIEDYDDRALHGYRPV